MWSDARELEAFYRTATGLMARRLLRRRLRGMWPNARGEAVLGFGFAVPYLGLFQGEAARVLALMPAEQGALHWPNGEPNLVALAEEDHWPLPDRSVDRVLLVHAVESSEALRAMLREAWRVLADGGKLLAVVPSRRSFWARAERTPFGHGRPFSQGQIERLLRDAMFTPLRAESALILPPFRARWLIGMAPAWDRFGRRWLGFLAGATLVEAAKQLYAGRALPVRAVRRRGFAVPGLARPAGRDAAPRAAAAAASATVRAPARPIPSSSNGVF
jgi:SAM-dependent methyltransferase